MNYTTFRRNIEAMGYSVIRGKDYIYASKGLYGPLVSVGCRSMYNICSDFLEFATLDRLEKEKLLDLAWQLASTPLAERSDFSAWQIPEAPLELEKYHLRRCQSLRGLKGLDK